MTGRLRLPGNDAIHVNEVLLFILALLLVTVTTGDGTTM